MTVSIKLSAFFLSVSLIFFFLGCSRQGNKMNQPEERRPNVLFIAVDDLRPQLNCYGYSQMISPNIDRMAQQGLLFSRAYCQVPVCGASRASLLTGLRPTRNRFLDYDTRVAEEVPDALTLPMHFKNNGYYTISNGKVFHHLNDMSDSWSEKPWHPIQTDSTKNWLDYALEENLIFASQNSSGRGPAYEMADVADTAYFDGKIAKKTISDLQRLKDQDQPFFLAVGFMKPHLPFNAPKKYWDLYEPDDLVMAPNPFRPEGAPDAAMHNWGELRNYNNIPEKGPLSAEMSRKLVHGYYACVSYTDAQIGKLLDAIEALDLADNTIVILWGDHGWNLGEHGLWCKHCNFETSLRAPLMIKVPGIEGGKQTNALTEFVDIYPSLCELTGLPVPHHLQGMSFVPLLTNPDQPWKEYAFSKWFNGFSIKNDRYRYTEWSRKDSNAVTEYARMLYDHVTDSLENHNIAEGPQNQELIRQMSDRLRQEWKEDFTP